MTPQQKKPPYADRAVENLLREAALAPDPVWRQDAHDELVRRLNHPPETPEART